MFDRRGLHRTATQSDWGCTLRRRFHLLSVFLRNLFLENIFRASIHFHLLLKDEQAVISCSFRRKMMSSFRGICLPCFASITLRLFCCDYPHFSGYSPQGWKQLNLPVLLRNRFFICNRKHVMEMI